MVIHPQRLVIFFVTNDGFAINVIRIRCIFNNLYQNMSILTLRIGDDQISASLRKKDIKGTTFSFVSALGRMAFLFNYHCHNIIEMAPAKGSIVNKLDVCFLHINLKSSILIGLFHFGTLPSVNISQAKIMPTQTSHSPITSTNLRALKKPEGRRYVRALDQLAKPHKNSCDLIRAHSLVIKIHHSVVVICSCTNLIIHIV